MKVRMEEKFKGKGIRKCRICGNSRALDKLAQALHVQKMLQGSCKGALDSRNTVDNIMDRFADAINKIKTNERIGRMECTLYSTKLLKAVLDVMKRESYIKDYEEFRKRG
jgi:hypothetical protein